MKRILVSVKSVPRWVVLLIDLCINTVCFTLSYFISKQFEFPAILRGHFFFYTSLYAVIALGCFYFMRIHTGLIRYSNVHDMFRIFLAVLITGIIYFPAADFFLARQFHITSLSVPVVLLINIFISSYFLFMFRILIRGF